MTALDDLTGSQMFLFGRAHENLAAAWLIGYRNAKTRASYAHSINIWFGFCDRIGADPLAALRAHVELYQREMEMEGKKPRTISGRLAALGSFYQYCIDEDVLTKSPMRGVRRPLIEYKSPTQHLNRPQFSDLIEGVRPLGWTPLATIMLLGFNGLRVAEACGIDTTDVSRTESYTVVNVLRKGGKRQDITLAVSTAHAVHKVLEDGHVGPLLLNRQGNRLDQKAVQRIIDVGMRNVRHPPSGRITPHSFRHTWCTLAQDAGVPLERIQADGGWADPRMPGTYYAHGHDNPFKAATHSVAALVQST